MSWDFFSLFLLLIFECYTKETLNIIVEKHGVQSQNEKKKELKLGTNPPKPQMCQLIFLLYYSYNL